MSESRKQHLIIKTRKATYSTNRTLKRRYRPSASSEKAASAIAYFKRKMFVNEYVGRGPNGYYTWLLKDTREGRILVAGHTRSQQELGTLHRNLDHFTDPGVIIAAGEFVKDEDYIMFNLQSGTYMLQEFKRLKTMGAKIGKRDELIALATTEFARIAGLRAEFKRGETEEDTLSGAPMIDIADIRTRLSEIREFDELLSHESSQLKNKV